MEKIKALLNKYSTGKNVLIFFIITQIFYVFMLVVTIPNVMEYAGGMKLLDMQPTGYSSQYANNLLDSLGEKGLRAYLSTQIPVDMIYPGLFAIAYSLLLFYIFKKGFKPTSKIYNLSLVPILTGLFDYLENIGIIAMIIIYPQFFSNIANITNIFSILKSLFTAIFFLLLLIGVVGLVIRRIRKNKSIAS